MAKFSEPRESFRPQWAELKEAHREQVEILENALRKHEQDRISETLLGERDAPSNEDVLRQQLDRSMAVEGLSKNHIEELSNALWLAEAELALLQRRYHRLTEPVGKGKKRAADPTDTEQLAAKTDFILHCAKLDQDEALQRDKEGLPPLPAWVHVECGKEGLTIRAAVRKALRLILKADTRAKLSPVEIDRMVNAKLDASVLAYRRWRTTQTKVRSTIK